MSDIDTAVVDSLKALDPEWPIREADILEPPLSAITGREQMQQIAGLFDHLIGERE